MCPLRVFLILFSAIIALVAALITFRDVWWPDKTKAKEKAAEPARTYTVLDFITLRYLYFKCSEWRAAWNASKAKAAQSQPTSCPLVAPPTAAAPEPSAPAAAAADSLAAAYAAADTAAESATA